MAWVVVALVAGPVLADSVVTYDLLLGGDNHADQVKAGTRVAYSGGSNAGGQVFPAGVLNWAATVAVAGNHTQPGHPSNGLPTQGVANMVVSVQLETPGGQVVSNADFYSSVHSGSGALDCSACPGGGGVCAGSAFALSYDLAGWGASRVTEAFEFNQYGGPFMEVCMFPTVQQGKILGTGAGYAQWCRGSGCGLASITTKGVGTDLGIKPVIEGQIDTSGLAAGTYVLRLTPGTGTNVLRGDVDLTTAPVSPNPQVQAFAVAANQAVGDTITFEIGGSDPCAGDTTAPTLLTAKSVKTHGGAGTFGVDVLAPSACEPRNGGVTKLVFTFDEDINGAGVNTTNFQALHGVSGNPVSISAVQVAGAVVTCDVTGSVNQDQLYVQVDNIPDLCGNLTSALFCVATLNGDVDGNESVTIFDLLGVRSALSQPVTASNFTKDLDAGGAINIFDLLAVRSKLSQTVSACP